MDIGIVYYVRNYDNNESIEEQWDWVVIKFWFLRFTKIVQVYSEFYLLSE